MRIWMKVSLLIILTLGLCWGGAVWFWRATNRIPAPGDMLMYLVALPVGILGAIWVGRTVFATMATTRTPASAATGVATPAVAAPAPSTLALALIGAAICAPHGAAADELSVKLLGGKARAELDPELVNRQGFPIMTQRHPEADDTATQDNISAWFAEQGLEELAFDIEHWRALTLATAVTAQVASQAVGELIAADGVAPMLYLQPMLPPQWHLDMRIAADSWLRNVVVQSGWPEKQLSLAAAVPVDARGTSAVAVLGRIAHQANASGVPLAAIVVSCASHLSEACIEKWSANDTLFSIARPHGQIAGEGAAALLLADRVTAQALSGLQHVMLHHEPEARRHHSADGAKQADAKALALLMAKLLADTGTQAGQIAMLITDTDHRTSRVLETLDLASSLLPHLDTTTEVLSVGTACGTCGAVPFIAALAVSHHHATELAAPVVCISNDDPYRRSAILIKPAAALS